MIGKYDEVICFKVFKVSKIILIISNDKDCQIENNVNNYYLNGPQRVRASSHNRVMVILTIALNTIALH